MKLVRKLFYFLSLLGLCCSALFLALLTAAGLLWGIYELFCGEPELSGIIFHRTSKQLAMQAAVCCVWGLGAGIGFVSNIVVLRRLIRNLK